MTQPRQEHDHSKRDPREQGQKWIPPERPQRVSKWPDDEKEDQADSGPDKDHPITQGKVK